MTEGQAMDETLQDVIDDYMDFEAYEEAIRATLPSENGSEELNVFDNEEDFMEYIKYLYQEDDVVNSPKHYTQGSVECIDALEAATINKVGIEAVCVANIIKYLWRYETKNGLEDVKKAQWYLEKLIERM